MKNKRLLQGTTLAMALMAAATSVQAAPSITRLTPPSSLFTRHQADPVIARFLPGQHFDLQVTAIPSGGASITTAVFLVDGEPVTATNPSGDPITVSAPVTTGLTAGLPAGTAVVSFRHYANLTPGVHKLSVIVKQSDKTAATASGNFEIVGLTAGGNRAKNIIVMIGDGMGASHRTAARIVKNGVINGKAKSPLAMDLFPVTGMVETSSLNSIVTDSAPGACCYSNGNKSNNNQLNVFPDDTLDAFDNPRVETMGEFLGRTQGKALGIITTADIFDATPAAFGSHTSNRGAGTGICDQYLDEIVPNSNLKVLMGGGRKWFLPAGTIGTARSAGNASHLADELATAWGRPVGLATTDAPARNLLKEFQDAGFTYTPTRAYLNGVSANTDKVLGLFAFSNMNVAYDKINGRRGVAAPGLGKTVVDAYGFPLQPMLNEMTDKALAVLGNKGKNPNGFVLMIEGASIDKQAHNMDSERWILDTIEFDYAVESVRQFVNANPDTLAIITADHECAGVAIIGASTLTNSDLTARASGGGGAASLRNGVVGTYDAAGFPAYARNSPNDGYPATMDVDHKMLIGYASNADRYEDWLTHPLPLQDSQQPTSGTPYGSISASLPALPINRDVAGNFLITGQVGDTTAVHTAGDIPLSAIGTGAGLFTGYQDNTDVFFKAMQVAVAGE